MRGQTPQVLVIGVGNLWRGDDAAGLLAARELRQRAAGRFQVREHDGEAAALIDQWDSSEALFLIDAVYGADPPGTIHRYDAGLGALPYHALRHSSHALGLGDSIELARILGRLPPRVLVYGIEGREFQAGGSVSAAVVRAIPEAASRIDAEIQSLLYGLQSI